MKSLFNIRSVTLIGLFLFILAACSATSPDVKEASVELSIDVVSEQETAERKSNWQDSYGTVQEEIENTFSAKSVVPESDVWQRVRAGFTMTPGLPLNKPTQQQLDRFLKNPQYLHTVIERARPYLHYIV